MHNYDHDTALCVFPLLQTLVVDLEYIIIYIYGYIIIGSLMSGYKTVNTPQPEMYALSIHPCLGCINYKNITISL